MPSTIDPPSNKPPSAQSPAVGGILCAGRGSRMAPLTDSIPKPLLPFLNTPLITFALDHLRQALIHDVGLNLHHLPEAFPPIVDPICNSMQIQAHYAREWELLGSAGGIQSIYKALQQPQKPLVLLNADAVGNFDLPTLLQQHTQSDKPITLLLRPKLPDQPGRVFLNQNLQLRGLRDFRHPLAQDEHLNEFDFLGVQILDPDFLQTIPHQEGCIIDDHYGPALEDGRDLFHIQIYDGFWAALDNPSLFLQNQRRVLLQPELLPQVPLPTPDQEHRFLFQPESLHDNTSLHGPLLTGLSVSSHDGASIGPNAVLDGVELGPNASIQNAAVYAMDFVDQTLHNCIAIAGTIAPLDQD